jgi:hypothetical protein
MIRASFYKAVLYVAVLAALLAGTGLLREKIHREREALGWNPRWDAEKAPKGLLSPETRTVLTSAALGIFRAMAIDFFWIRALTLEEKGEFFESAALSRLITALQPRLPAVWTFQSRNLAYNISSAFPPRERYSWVRQGIELLRDDALEFNPGSPAVLLELAFLFQHKIGLDFDEAGHIYRSRLAAEFEVDRDSPPGRELFKAWSLDPAHIAAIEAMWKVRLDFRAAESHALYWAELGLQGLESGTRAFTRRGLRQVRNSSLLQLFSGGKPARAPGGKTYAFLPDIRFLDAARQVLETDLKERLEPRSGTDAAEEELTRFLGKAIFFQYLSGRRGEAEALLAASRSRFGGASLGLNEFILRSASFLTGVAPDDASASADLQSLSGCLAASLYLELAGDETLARGFQSLALLFHGRAAASSGGAPLPGFKDCRAAAAGRLCRRWMKKPEILETLPGSLRDLCLEAGPDQGESALPDPEEVPLRLDLIDPARPAEVD